MDTPLATIVAWQHLQRSDESEESKSSFRRLQVEQTKAPEGNITQNENCPKENKKRENAFS